MPLAAVGTFLAKGYDLASSERLAALYVAAGGVVKHNPHHDGRGRFTTAEGAGGAAGGSTGAKPQGAAQSTSATTKASLKEMKGVERQLIPKLKGKTDSASEEHRHATAASLGERVQSEHPGAFASPEEATAFTDAVIEKWNHTSGDHDPQAVAIQLAAASVFGGEAPRFGIDAETLNAAHEAYAANRTQYNSTLQSMYAQTQEHLARNGITEVAVMRGMAFDPPPPDFARPPSDPSHGPVISRQPVAVNPLSSWTINPDVAIDFARGQGGDLALDHVPPIGMVVVAKIPASRILSTAMTGAGTPHERELVMLGNEPVDAGMIWNNPQLNGAFVWGAGTSFKLGDTDLLGKRMVDLPNLDEDLVMADWLKPDSPARIAKSNPNHDARGRFATSPGAGGAASGAEQIRPSVQKLLDAHQAAGVGQNRAISHGAADAEVDRFASAVVEMSKQRAGEELSRLATTASTHDHGHLVGADFRVKGIASTKRKIAADMAAEGISAREAADRLGDGLRFTTVFTPEGFGHHVEGMVNDLGAQGYRVLKWKNTFGPGNLYQGINANLVTPDGKQVIELQFHTEQSLRVKEEGLHHVYNVRRELPAGHPDLPALDAETARISSLIVQPEGVGSIPNFARGSLAALSRPHPFAGTF